MFERIATQSVEVVVVTQLRHLGAVADWNRSRPQLNSKNHTTVHVMDSTSLVPAFVGDPHGVPRTPDRQDPLLLAASNSPLEPEGDDALMPATGTSAESPLFRDSPGAGPGANPGDRIAGGGRVAHSTFLGASGASR